MRFFTTEGPVRPDRHYSLPPLARWDLDEILGLIDQEKYFLLHAPRQTGKTSCLLALMEHLNRDGRYRAVYANLEIAQTAREDVARGMRAICGSIAAAARLYIGDERLFAWNEAALATRSAEGMLCSTPPPCSTPFWPSGASTASRCSGARPIARSLPSWC